MPRGNQIEYLEDLRKRARTAYFYLGFLLICVFVAGLLLDTTYFLGVGVLAAILYLFLLRNDIKQYPAEYRRIATLNSVGCCIQANALIPKNLFTLEQVKKDGCIVVENTHGIVRAGVTGTYHGNKVYLSDISYTVQQTENGSKRAEVRSGCYIRIELKNEDSEAEDFCRNTGRYVIKKENGFIYGFISRRYLGMKEPSLKRAVTEQEINPEVFSELADFLRECGML